MDPRELFAAKFEASARFVFWSLGVFFVFFGAAQISSALGYLLVGLLLWFDSILGRLLSKKSKEDER